MRTRTPALLVVVLCCGLAAVAAPSARGTAKAPLLVLTGYESEVEAPRYRVTRSQAIFDEVWTAHMGERVQKAAQGWPMTPTIDFAACDAIFIFGGDGFNANGYRVMEIVEADDAVTIRFERISYQTASFDGEDPGVAVRPWALLLMPTTKKTIFLEENVQGIIGGPPVWKERIAFPGQIGIGRPVKGTRQTGVGR